MAEETEYVIAVNSKKVKVKSAELILFTTQLSVMLESGVVLSEAIEGIAIQLKPSPFKTIVTNIASNINSGISFSAALSEYPKVFNSMFISLVKASEASGKMPEMLDVLSQYLNDEEQTKKQVQGAMIYPIIMVIMAIVATTTLMVFVLPRFTKIYEARGAALPVLTQALVSCSNVLTDSESMTFAATIVIILGVGYHYWAQTIGGRKVLDGIKVQAPAFGTMYVDAAMTRAMRIIATMVNTGVGLLETLDVVKISCPNYHFQQLWNDAEKKLKDGYQLSDSLVASQSHTLILPGIIQMLRAGEKSGKMGYVCDKASIFYEKRLQNSIKAATSMIEPVMITIMGVVIGTIAIALLLPVFKISSVISQ